MADGERECLKSDEASTLTTSQNISSKRYNSDFTETLMPISVCKWVELFLGKYGYFCATHAWECICSIVTITLCVLSCNLLRLKPQYSDKENQDKYLAEENILCLITNCLAVLYLYTQFNQLQKVGFKYTLAIAGIFLLFSSITITFQILILFGFPLPSLDQGIPFLFLITDVGKAKQIALYAYGSRNRKEACARVSQGVSVIGPTITLEAIVVILILIMSSATIFGMLSVCFFGILWIIIYYILFISFIPATFALLFESCPTGEPVRPLDSLARAMADNNRIRKNPVIHRVRLIMFLGLSVIYIHSSLPFTSAGTSLPWPDALYVLKLLGRELSLLSPEKYVALSITIFLSVKYIFLDNQETLENDQGRAHISPVSFKQLSDIKDINISHVLSGHSGSLMENVCSAVEVSTQTNDEHVGFQISSTPMRSTIFSIKDNLNDDQFQEPNCDVEILSTAELLQPLLESKPRSLEICLDIFNSDKYGPSFLRDDEIELLVDSKYIQAYKLEDALEDPIRGVAVRRNILSKKLSEATAIDNVSYLNYNYKLVMGACCENVIGYIQIPLGIAGPLLLDGTNYYVPMSTTEGCLVASTNRGCRALSMSGGAKSSVLGDSMSRGPVVRFPSAILAAESKTWLEKFDNYEQVKTWFDSSSRFARLTSLKVNLAGRMLYIRFNATTGDAMGMNMTSKATEITLLELQKIFTNMEILSVSGNFCVDKKPSAMNWLEGRGKSVVAEATIPGKIISQVMKTSVKALVELNISKNLVGSAMSGSMGGFNAHSANIVSAIFIACGQDPAQVVSSSNCITLMEECGHLREDLYISVTMPSIEVGTVGGGTILPGQNACLRIVGAEGSNPINPGEKSRLLARVVCGAVLAGELSLMSALAAGHLVRSHMRHNRSSISLNMKPIVENQAQ